MRAYCCEARMMAGQAEMSVIVEENKEVNLEEFRSISKTCKRNRVLSIEDEKKFEKKLELTKGNEIECKFDAVKKLSDKVRLWRRRRKAKMAPTLKK